MELKTIEELNDLTRDELFSEALNMRTRIKYLEANLDITSGYLELACRPKDEAEH